MSKVIKILTQKKIKITFFVVLLTNLFCVDDKFTKLIVVFRDENAADKFVKAILKEYEYCKKVAKKQLQQKYDHE